MSESEIVIPLTDQFDREFKEKYNVGDVPEETKRYLMMIRQKQKLNLPLTEKESKLV